MRQTSRRALLAGVATAALAGCLGDDESSESGSPTESQGTNPTQTQSPSGTRTDGPGVTTRTATSTTTPTTVEETATPTTVEETATPTETGTPTPNITPDEDSSLHESYERTILCVRSTDGALRGCVYAAIADTPSLRYTGLSETESLPENRGMLFVFSSVGEHTFVMREMDFGLDIVYADDAGVITEIHHAPAPGPDEDGNDQQYPGRGQYVLEVNREWTTERGVSEGDVLQFDLE